MRKNQDFSTVSVQCFQAGCLAQSQEFSESWQTLGFNSSLIRSWRQTTRTVCSSATIFKLCAYLERHFFLGDVRHKNFPKCKSEQKDLCGWTQVSHNMPNSSHLNIDTNHHHFQNFLSFSLICLPLNNTWAPPCPYLFRQNSPSVLHTEFNLCNLSVMR